MATRRKSANEPANSVGSSGEPHCPKCDLPISANASVCPHCHSALQKEPEPYGASAGKVAKFIRDWIGFPAAVIALITNFYTPTVGAILSWFDQDRAFLQADVLNTDLINVGIDDRLDMGQTERAEGLINIIRISLHNNGYSRASVGANFVCSVTPRESKEQYYLFDFVDLSSQAKTFPTLDAGETAIVFARFTSSMEREQHQLTRVPDSCEVQYFDRYGRRDPAIVALTSQARTLVDRLPNMEGQASDLEHAVTALSMTPDADAWPTRYCDGMISRFRVSTSLVADCLSSTHVFAIEPLSLASLAISRAMRGAAAFDDLTGGNAKRQPAVILICDPETCAAETEALRKRVDRFTPALRISVCNPEKPGGLAGCFQLVPEPL